MSQWAGSGHNNHLAMVQGAVSFLSPLLPPQPGSRQVEPYGPGVGKMSCGFLFWKPNHLNAFLCVEQTVGVQNDSLQPAAWRGS